MWFKIIGYGEGKNFLEECVIIVFVVDLNVFVLMFGVGVIVEF